MAGTIIIAAIIAGYVCYVIRGIYKKKKNGESVTCSCGCGGCSGCKPNETKKSSES